VPVQELVERGVLGAARSIDRARGGSRAAQCDGTPPAAWGDSGRRAGRRACGGAARPAGWKLPAREPAPGGPAKTQAVPRGGLRPAPLRGHCSRSRTALVKEGLARPEHQLAGTRNGYPH
jgi:hypothetical protein